MLLRDHNGDREVIIIRFGKLEGISDSGNILNCNDGKHR